MTNRCWTPSPCCCLNLGTGGVLIGIFELIIWSIVLTASGLSLVTVSGLLADSDEASVISPLSSTSRSETMRNEVDPLWGMYMMLILSVTHSAVQILNGSVLLLGIQRASIFLLKTWLCIKMLGLFFNLGSFILIVTRGSATIGLDMFYSGSLLTSVYFIWVIIALIDKMKLNSGKQATRYKF